MNTYRDAASADNYLTFLNSENGQLQQQFLSKAIIEHLNKNPLQTILDCCCGSGWLTKQLSRQFPEIQGCDSSEQLVTIAKKQYKGIKFTMADAAQPLPYAQHGFDVVILNMAAPDIADLPKAVANIFSVLKPTGQLLMTIPNPYYTYPIALWKRSIMDILLGRKPKLRLQSHKTVKKIIRKPGFTREFNSRTFGQPDAVIQSHFYTLPEYLSLARTAGFSVITLQELRSNTDSAKFNLQYQLYRYPLLLLIELVKPQT